MRVLERVQPRRKEKRAKGEILGGPATQFEHDLYACLLKPAIAFVHCNPRWMWTKYPSKCDSWALLEPVPILMARSGQGNTFLLRQTIRHCRFLDKNRILRSRLALSETLPRVKPKLLIHGAGIGISQCQWNALKRDGYNWNHP
jgi:hypothetical protein